MKQEAAFATPSVFTSDGKCENGTYGLTKREYFAAQALTDLAGTDDTPANIAKTAVEIADALVNALNN